MSGLVRVIDVVAYGVGGVGVLCLVSAIGLALFVGADDRLSRNRLHRTPVLRGGDLASVATPLPRAVSVHGRADAGPLGPITAPLSKRECAWFRVQIWRQYSDSENVLSEEVVWERASSDTLRLTDGSGTFGISAALLDRDLPGSDDSPVEPSWSDSERGAGEESGLDALRAAGMIGRDDYAKRRGGTTMYWVEEQLVPVGREMVVLGAPRRGADGTVVMGRSAMGRSGVSAGPIGYLRDEVKTADRDTWSTVRGLTKVGMVTAVPGLAWVWLVQPLLSGG